MKKILRKLPSKYKEFLLKCSEKRPIKNAFDIPNEGSSLIDIFYNISNDDLKPLANNPDILAIGNDQNGNIIGIGISTSNYNKIFFIDHETLNIVKLSDSFSSFIDNLYKYKDEDLIEELIKNNDIEGIKKLIENGFDIHQKNKYGRTILEEATVFAKNDIIKFLHNIGANLENSIKIAEQNSEFFDEHKKTLELLKKLDKR